MIWKSPPPDANDYQSESKDSKSILPSRRKTIRLVRVVRPACTQH